MCHMGIAISKDHLDWAAVAASNREVVHEGHQPNTATGTYHFPRLADLVAAQLPVAVVNPAQLKGDRQRQLGRTHTDRQDARLLARFGVARASESRLYAPPSPCPRQLSAWMSYRDRLIAEQTRLAGRRQANRFHGDDQVRRWLAEVDAAIEHLLATLPEAPVLREMIGVGPRVTPAVRGYLPVDVWGHAIGARGTPATELAEPARARTITALSLHGSTVGGAA